ncbi:DUF488 domain-containing protein [Enteractinococcus coprophilus]|uniref:Uncharacterized protein YeaO (DUF488 family) n=1 Tax=Enteractinococcus coprophilus TaxID=1027633 RepID=A0A543ALZ5_9MICC|nr:DUF488 family protein [Enteractinococcus coprophilus]TQL73598.1 uncharacterized protein YeaO (DUF488 family) [Enteractinococcus coprophilus]
MSSRKIVIKRIYDDADDSDGLRVLVDRIWPRGVSKEQAQLDHWLRNIAPSRDLRRWWDHDPNRLDEFAERYEQELSDEDHEDAVDEIIQLIHDNERVTLLYAAKDKAINHASILQDYLRRHS